MTLSRGAELAFAVCVLGGCISGPPPPPDRLFIEVAQTVMRQSAKELLPACDAKDVFTFRFVTDSIEGRRGFDSETGTWPGRVRQKGGLSCIRSGFPANFDFDVTVVADVERADSGRPSGSGDIVEHRFTEVALTAQDAARMSTRDSLRAELMRLGVAEEAYRKEHQSYNPDLQHLKGFQPHKMYRLKPTVLGEDFLIVELYAVRGGSACRLSMGTGQRTPGENVQIECW